MAKVSVSQASFNSGELSPLVYARSDVAKYKNGMGVLLNAYPLIQGGWTCRPGTYYVAPTKANGVARFQRFEFSTTQAYMGEFGNLYFRPYKDHAAITETALVITGITQANPGVLTYTGSDPSNGDDIELASIVGMTQLNGRRVTVGNVNAGANTFELLDPDGVTNINTTSYTAYSSGGTASRVYTVTTPYVTADLFQLKFTQSADVLYITHPSYAPRKLTRTAHATWTLSTIVFKDGPYLATNTTTTTLLLSGTTGSVTVTASAAVFTVTTDIGRLIRWKDAAGNWTWLTITATASTTSVTATISGPDASDVTATVNWRLGVWSITTGFPAAVVFNEDRLCFGGPTLYPQRVDMSNSGEYENFAPTSVAGLVGDANAIAITLNASDVNVIRWLQDDEKGLLVGTVGGEWILRASSQGEAISPSNITAKRSRAYGSANIQALRAGPAVLFVQRAGRKLRELAYVFERDGFNAPDMTVLSEHITLGGIIQLAYQQETQATVWMPRADGVLVGFTYEREQEVLGWHRHILGGYSDSLSLQIAKVESVACIPAPDQTRDETWVMVNRYINGKTSRHVEYMTKPWERGDAITDGNTINASVTLGTGVEDLAVTLVGATLKSTDTEQDIWASRQGGLARAASATAHYYPLSSGLTAVGTTTEANARNKVGYAGTAKNLRCYLSANTYTVDGTLKLFKNGSAVLTTTITLLGGAGWYENTADSITFTDTDELSYEFVGGTTGSITINMVGVTLKPDVAAAATNSNFFMFMGV